jgi:mRNA interferase MazF
MSVRRGDIYYADLSPVVGSEQGGLRPVLIIQNDVGNKYSPTVIAAAITSRMSKARLPTHIDVYADRVGLQKDSVILLEQIRTLDKRRLKEKMGHLDEEMMDHVNTAIAISFGLGDAKQDAEARARMQSLPSYTPARTPAAGMPNVAAGMPNVAAGMPNVAVASTQSAPTGVANPQNAATGVANPPTAAAVGTSLPSASASAEPQAKSPERE